MTPDEMIDRLLTIYGEPRTDNVEMFIAEYRRSMSGYIPAVLAAACQRAIDEHTFWPRPAELRAIANTEAVRITGSRRAAEHQPFAHVEFTPPDEEARARVGALVAETIAFLQSRGQVTGERGKVDWDSGNRPAFEFMQATSPSGIHLARGGRQ
jgi:hypothetical protein